MIMIFITILSLACAVIFILLSLKYLHLYRNLRANFKSFLDFVDSKYIPKNDVAVLNATIEALDQAKEKDNKFEIKMYTRLLQRLRERD